MTTLAVEAGTIVGVITGVTGALFGGIALYLQFRSMKRQDESEKVRIRLAIHLREQGGTTADSRTFVAYALIFNRSGFEISVESLRWGNSGQDLEAIAWFGRSSAGEPRRVEARGRARIDFLNSLPAVPSCKVVEIETSCGHVQRWALHECLSIRRLPPPLEHAPT